LHETVSESKLFAVHNALTISFSAGEILRDSLKDEREADMGYLSVYGVLRTTEVAPGDASERRSLSADFPFLRELRGTIIELPETYKIARDRDLFVSLHRVSGCFN
jgi:hypothetical protein